MPITFHADDLNLKSANWDHIYTDHALEAAATMHGWVRKSQWYGTETSVRDLVGRAFQTYKGSIAGVTTLATDANGRSVVNVNLHEGVGTGTDGNPTTWARLVLEIRHSGDAHIVTAFPV